MKQKCKMEQCGEGTGELRSWGCQQPIHSHGIEVAPLLMSLCLEICHVKHCNLVLFIFGFLFLLLLFVFLEFLCVIALSVL